jgi:hypothetical protein
MAYVTGEIKQIFPVLYTVQHGGCIPYIGYDNLHLIPDCIDIVGIATCTPRKRVNQTNICPQTDQSMRKIAANESKPASDQNTLARE